MKAIVENQYLNRGGGGEGWVGGTYFLNAEYMALKQIPDAANM